MQRLGSLIGVALATLVCAFPGFAAELPSLGDGSSAIVSKSGEQAIGRAVLKQIHSTSRTIADPVLKYHMSRHLLRLAEKAELHDVTLVPVLIDSPEINAFAVPGGVVGINLGLYAYAEDVHEYSSVVAHELAHLSQRHFARQVEAQKGLSIANIVGVLASVAIAATVSGDAGMAALMGSRTAAEDNVLRYSRAREQEADRVGLATLARAGYDPLGQARMFERMQRNFRFVKRPPEFLLTHPLSETRIADARNQASEYDVVPAVPSTDYQMMRARAKAYFAESPQRAVLEANARKRDDVVTRYARLVAYGMNDQHERAMALGRQVLEEVPDSLLVAATYAEVLIEAGEFDQAVRFVESQLALTPDNPALTMMYARALNGLERYDETVRVLRRHTRLDWNDVDAWFLLAETAGLAGDIVEVHRARAEYFTLHGAYSKAIQHLEYARRQLFDSQTSLHAAVTQRIQDLRTEAESYR